MNDTTDKDHQPQIHEFPVPAKTTKKTTKELKPGDVIRHNEKSWIIDSIELAPADPRRPGQWFDVEMHPQQSRVFFVAPLVYDFEVFK